MTQVGKERWREADALLERALELPPDERSDAVESWCGEDHELCNLVLSLLSREGSTDPLRPGTLLEGAHFRLEKEDLVRPTAMESDLAGTRVGPYTLGTELGRGGMAVVYAAERTDGAYEQKVAIKLLHSGDRAAISERFRRERRILASLDHPNITRLLDGGALSDGRPFFVMERVDGQPIDQYCETLPLAQKLDLWCRVADAVAYAHRRLLVHRDLKPSNILVSPNSGVKLLDFGIAKLLDSDHSQMLTASGLRPMTPRYASPEQVVEGEITTATDIYQLGVLLYELLSGRSPYGSDSSRVALEDAIRFHEPKSPSSVSSRRELRGDLDAIVLKAIRKDPAERYGSVEAMAADVRAFGMGQAVSARPLGAIHRLGRFVRRHRIAMSAAMGLVLLLAALVTFHTLRLAEERDRAREEARKAEQVSVFLTGLFRGGNPELTGSEELTARDLLDHGAERLDELADQPAIQAEVQSVIGRSYLALGQHEDARKLQEAALATVRELGGDYLDDVSEILNRLGILHHELGRLDEADRALQESLEIRRALPEPNAVDIAGSLNNLGMVSRSKGELEAARDYYEEAIEIKERVLGPDDRSVANSLTNLAGVYSRLKDYERSVALNRRAVAIFERLEHPALGSALTNLADTLRKQGELEEAASHLERALEIKEAVYGTDHPRIAGTLNILANVRSRRGDRSGAEELYERAMAIYREGYGPDHPRVATPLTNLARLALDEEDFETSITRFRAALEIREKRLGPQDPKVAQTRIRLARALLGQGDLGAVETEVEMALQVLGAESRHAGWVSEGLFLLGQALTRSDRSSEAVEALRRSLSFRIQDLGRDHEETGRVQLALGNCLLRLGHREEASQVLGEVAERFPDSELGREASQAESLFR